MNYVLFEKVKNIGMMNAINILYFHPWNNIYCAGRLAQCFICKSNPVFYFFINDKKHIVDLLSNIPTKKISQLPNNKKSDSYFQKTRKIKSTCKQFLHYICKSIYVHISDCSINRDSRPHTFVLLCWFH